MTKLIVNADDYGYSEGVNHGIISAHKNGIVTSCTVMANMPGFEHGIELLKEAPDLGCGVHMTLTCYKPILAGHKTIVDKDGNYYRKPTEDVLESLDLDEVYKEFCAQIEKVRERVEITHLDSHHHVHGSETLRPVIQEIMNKYKLPMRQSSDVVLEGVKSVPLIGHFYKDNASVEFFKKNIDLIKSYEIVDMMSHPAFIDTFLLGSTSYAMERAKEHSILTNKELKRFLEENEIELVNYRAVK